MLHEGIVAALVGTTPTSGLLAGNTGEPDRVYPLVIPQKVPHSRVQQTPCVVYQVRNVDRQVTYCGTSGLVRSEVQLDSYATSYDGAVELAAGVREVLTDFRGALGGVVSVRHAALQTEFDLQDPDPGLYRVSQLWVFWHEE